MGRYLSKTIIYFFLAIVAFITLFPILYVILASFKTNQELMVGNNTLLPKAFIMDNYIEIWNSPDFHVPTLFKNSIVYSVVIVVCQLFMTSMAGYVFARGYFTGKKIVFACFTALLFVNLGTATTVPLLKITKALNLNGSLGGLMLIRALGINVSGIYLVNGFISPRSL